MICTQQVVATTSRTVNALAAVSINNDVVLKEAIDQTNVKLTLKAEKTDETLEDLIVSETKQHETTQQVLSDELQALKRQYSDQLELNKKTAESLNSLQTLLESIYATLPLYQSRNPRRNRNQNVQD
jgi:TRAP-type mannitol/chloroaromatic compound transport system substrate-binding protein